MNADNEDSETGNRFGINFPPGTPRWLQDDIVKEARLDLEAEFKFWCIRQVRKGNGIDCRSRMDNSEIFVGLRCYKCSFVYINPTPDIVNPKTSIHFFAERIGNSITENDEELVCAKCPKCGDVCISNYWPLEYSTIEQLTNIFVRFWRKFGR